MIWVIDINGNIKNTFDGSVSVTGDVNVLSSALPTGASTSAKQDTGNTSLSSIDTKLSTVATSTKQSDGSQKTQIVDAGGDAVTVTGGKLDVNAAIDTTGLATSTIQTDGTQKTQIVDAGGEQVTVTGGKLDVNASVDTTGLATELKQDDEITLLTSIAGEDFATQTTLAALNTKVTAVNTGAVVVSSSALPTGAAIAANQQTDALTDTELRATPVPVSGTVTATPSGTQNVDVTANTIGLSTAAKQDAQTALLTTIDGDTGNISTKIDTIAGAIAGTEMQVDVLTMPTVTVQATNLDVRDLTFAADKVDASGTVLGAGTNNIGDVDVLTLPSIPAGNNNIGDVDIASMPNVVIGSGTVTSITNNVNTVEVSPTTIFNGKTSVTTAGTRVTLNASQAVKSVTIKALAANTGIIYVGNATVASTNGFQLAAGDTLSLEISNLNTINLDSSVNAEGVSWVAVN